jgi:hypothetical protein
MPSKGKRVASRQNNLRRRRNTSNRQAAVGANPVAAPPDALSPANGGTAVGTAETNGVGPAAATVPEVAPRPVQQPRGRRFDRPAAYGYVGSELVRIGIFSGVLLVALIAVSFVI